MKGRLKVFVVPTIYALSLIMFVFSMYFIQEMLTKTILKEKSNSKEETEYVDGEIIESNNYMPVVGVEETIIKPFTSDEVKVSKDFYNYQDDVSEQQNSIIYYENTYMQNSGIDYSSDSQFDVVSVLDGTVIDVKNDSVLGTVVEIRHSNELISIYQSLSEITVKVDDKVIRGQVIGKSGKSNLNVGIENNLHFELYYMGEIVNPDDYYNKKLTDL